MDRRAYIRFTLHIRCGGPLFWLLAPVNKTLQLSIPIVSGAAAHVLLHYALLRYSPYSFGDTLFEPNSGLTMYIYPWLYVVMQLIPGFITGVLSRNRPLLYGFLAVAIGQLAILFFLREEFFTYLPRYGIFMLTLQLTFMAAAYGLVSSAAGFLSKRALTTQSRGLPCKS